MTTYDSNSGLALAPFLSRSSTLLLVPRFDLALALSLLGPSLVRVLPLALPRRPTRYVLVTKIVFGSDLYQNDFLKT